MNAADPSARQDEAALDPQQCIVDAHHHLYDRPGTRYLLDDLLRDLRCGHDVRATVFVQARSMFRSAGPEALKPVGETEFAQSVFARCAGSDAPGVQVCAAIVGQADLMLGENVRPVLEAHLAAGGGQFRGIRHVAAWDRDAKLLNPAYPTSEDMLASDAFRAGFAQLAALGLSFDAWLLCPQLPRLTALARAFPEVPIVLNHCGGIVGVGRYALRRDEVYAQWRQDLLELARCPNVMVKLGGLGMPLSGFGFDLQPTGVCSMALAAAWRPWILHCIEAFGADRCMFESNFPADRASYGYSTGWNAFKRIAANASPDEKSSLFWRSAARFYRLPKL